MQDNRWLGLTSHHRYSRCIVQPGLEYLQGIQLLKDREKGAMKLTVGKDPGALFGTVSDDDLKVIRRLLG